jgi:RNA polymerase sigma factor (sigma-70 family)
VSYIYRGGENVEADVEKHMHIVDEVVSRYCSNHSDWKDDAKGEGLLELWEAALTWKEKDGNFEAYARTCIRNRVLNFIRDSEMRQNVVVLDDNIEDYTHENTAELSLLQKEAIEVLKNRVAEIIDSLNNREQYVLQYYILLEDRETLTQIAKRFGCHRSSIERDKNRILRRLIDA